MLPIFPTFGKGNPSEGVKKLVSFTLSQKDEWLSLPDRLFGTL